MTDPNPETSPLKSLLTGTHRTRLVPPIFLRDRPFPLLDVFVRLSHMLPRNVILSYGDPARKGTLDVYRSKPDSEREAIPLPTAPAPQGASTGANLGARYAR
jgi:hypothetical protein